MITIIIVDAKLKCFHRPRYAVRRLDHSRLRHAVANRDRQPHALDPRSVCDARRRSLQRRLHEPCCRCSRARAYIGHVGRAVSLMLHCPK